MGFNYRPNTHRKGGAQGGVAKEGAVGGPVTYFFVKPKPKAAGAYLKSKGFLVRAKVRSVYCIIVP